MRKFKITRDPNDIGCKIYQKGTATILPGLTVLVGCNGSGKTTLLQCIRYLLKDEDIPVISFDNLRDGGSHARSRASFYGDLTFLATSMCASEGENINMNLTNFAGTIGKFIKSNSGANELWILLDAVDSGLSVDNVLDLKFFLNKIIETNTSSSVYIVVSANEYELANGESCYDVVRGRYRKFRSYQEYRNFILRTREIKDMREYSSQN